MGHKTYNYKINYIDDIYEFKGLWDMPSRCGLKVVKKKEKTIVIVTDLYHENPGTSVTGYCTQLATIIAEDKNIEPDKLVFIQHNPDIGSKYDFLVESFDLVSFNIKNGQFINPKWKKISKNTVKKMLEKT